MGEMMKYGKNALLKMLIVLWSVSTFSVAAQQVEGRQAQKLGTVVDPKGEVFEKTTIISPPLTQLIIYRLLDSKSQNAAGVEINGHYHTSLQAGSYSELCMPAPVHALISTRMAELQQTVRNDVDATKKLDLQPTQAAYLRITELSDGRAKLDVVTPETAKKELQQTYLQLHAASRVPNAGSCSQELVGTAKAATAQKEVETIDMEVDALFGFAKADIQSLSHSGHQALKALADQLQNKYANLDNIHLQINGYADPLGNALLNDRLSEQRARTIYDFLVAAGINPNKLSYEGKGATDLIVKNCGRLVTPESIACNRPNRRVVVNVSTLKQ